MKKIKMIIMLGLFLSISSHAEDRALIIGITEYKNSQFNLTGIDLDVNMAKHIVQMLSYTPNQVRVLTGTQATSANIEASFKNWLVDGVGANDRVFVYFSGHGGSTADKNGDEADGKDEFITAYDTPLTLKGQGIIMDDELSKWIANIPSNNKIVMLDSCHSGTATRSIEVNSHKLSSNKVYPKRLQLGNDGIAKNIKKSMTKEAHSGFIDGQKNLITLAAAQDWESALATQDGSIFTLGVFKALSISAQKNLQVTPVDIVDAAGTFIANAYANDPDKIHTPIIFGDKNLALKPFKIKSSRNGQGPNWTQYTELVKKFPAMQASVNKQSFREGDLIKFNVEIPINGYLNIVNVDAHDESLVLFPNQYNRNNKINKGHLQVPGDLMPFEIEASLPAGESVTVFFVTSAPLNLYEESINARSVDGKYVETFAEVSPASYRSMRLKAKKQKKQTFATMIKTTVN